MILLSVCTHFNTENFLWFKYKKKKLKILCKITNQMHYLIYCIFIINVFKDDHLIFEYKSKTRFDSYSSNVIKEIILNLFERDLI